jgi:hypothetical protein
MIGHKKGEDINDAIKGPVGYIGLGIIVLGLGVALANNWDSTLNPPDNPVFFGGYIADVIYEIKYYLYAIIPLVIIMGAVMVGLQLRIYPVLRQ